MHLPPTPLGPGKSVACTLDWAFAELSQSLVFEDEPVLRLLLALLLARGFEICIKKIIYFWASYMPVKSNFSLHTRDLVIHHLACSLLAPSDGNGAPVHLFWGGESSEFLQSKGDSFVLVMPSHKVLQASFYICKTRLLLL